MCFRVVDATIVLTEIDGRKLAEEIEQEHIAAFRKAHGQKTAGQFVVF